MSFLKKLFGSSKPEQAATESAFAKQPSTAPTPASSAQTADDEIIDLAIRQLRAGELAQAARTLQRSGNPHVRREAQSVLQLAQTIGDADRHEVIAMALGGSGGSQAYLQRYLEREIPYLEGHKQQREVRAPASSVHTPQPPSPAPVAAAAEKGEECVKSEKDLKSADAARALEIRQVAVFVTPKSSLGDIGSMLKSDARIVRTLPEELVARADARCQLNGALLSYMRERATVKYEDAPEMSGS